MLKKITKRSKSEDLPPKQTDLIPLEFRHAGLGEWSFSPNGYSRFLEGAIIHFKEAATRCADQGLTEEYKIFNKRAQVLQRELENYQKGHSSTKAGHG